MRAFLRDPNPYLREFQRKPLKLVELNLSETNYEYPEKEYRRKQHDTRLILALTKF